MHLEIHKDRLIYVTGVSNKQYFYNDSISIPKWAWQDICQIKLNTMARFYHIEIHSYLTSDPDEQRSYIMKIGNFIDEIWWGNNQYGVLRLEDYRCE